MKSKIDWKDREKQLLKSVTNSEEMMGDTIV